MSRGRIVLQTRICRLFQAVWLAVCGAARGIISGFDGIGWIGLFLHSGPNMLFAKFLNRPPPAERTSHGLRGAGQTVARCAGAR